MDVSSRPQTSNRPHFLPIDIDSLVRQQIVNTMRETLALDHDEELVYFYSDAMTDITEGFYFVSVVVYSEQFGDEPLTIIPFDQIEEVTLDRDESFLVDSEITIVMTNGDVVTFRSPANSTMTKLSMRRSRNARQSEEDPPR